jgi:hypothetical protein
MMKLTKHQLENAATLGRLHADAMQIIVGDSPDKAAAIDYAIAKLREGVVGELTVAMKGLGASDADIQRYVDHACFECAAWNAGAQGGMALPPLRPCRLPIRVE